MTMSESVGLPAAGVSAAPAEEWPYLVVMQTAMAMIADHHVKAADEVWVAAWAEILENDETRGLLPKLAAAPVSRKDAVRGEVEELKRVLLRAGFAALENPSYQRMTLQADSMRSITEGHRDLVEKHGPTLQKMAAILERRLTVRADAA